MSRLHLRDHIDEILASVSEDLKTKQTKAESIRKSHGESDSCPEHMDTAAELHGDQRYDDGFDVVQMVSEYRALRSSIIKLWTESKTTLDNTDVKDLTRFNEAIDQALAESVVKFNDKVDYSRNLLLGVLAHDLRSPLSTISMAGALLGRLGPLNEKQAAVTETFMASGDRMTHILSDLLDLARASHGTGLPIAARPMNIRSLAEHMVAETKTGNPDCHIILEIDGDTSGVWDSTRLGQLLSNLLGNAIQYGYKTSPVRLTIKGTKDLVSLIVHNEGPPIPPTQINSLFNSFTRGPVADVAENVRSNLGLGLFITNEIVKSHAGKIDVRSTEADGTSFVITLPKRPA
ncbi:MAG: HAMP domain-containing sensor histidine kinase [Asticcacaulis sp.]